MAAVVDIGEVQVHLRLTDDQVDESYLNGLIAAAQSSCELLIGRPADPEQLADGSEIPPLSATELDAFRMAVLVTIAALFQDRDGAEQLPRPARWLLAPLIYHGRAA